MTVYNTLPSLSNSSKMLFSCGIAQRLKLSNGSAPDDQQPLLPSLAGIAKLGGAREETVLEISKDGEGELVAILTQAELSVWTVRPSVLICKVKRTHRSIYKHGLNESVCWKLSFNQQEPTGLLVKTTKSKLLYFSLQVLPPSVSLYQMPTRPTSGPSIDFPDGTGEGVSLPAMVLRAQEHLDFESSEITAICASEDYLVVATAEPPALVTIPWTIFLFRQEKTTSAFETSQTLLSSLDWLIDKDVLITSIVHSPLLQNFALVTSCGRVYNAREASKMSIRGLGVNAQKQEITTQWRGSCLHGAGDLFTDQSPVNGLNVNGSSSPSHSQPSDTRPAILPEHIRACQIAINARLSMIAVGTNDGLVHLYTISQVTLRSIPCHVMSLRDALKTTASHLTPDYVTTLAWTADGHALAVGWRNGFSVWSAYGKLTRWAVNGDVGSGDLAINECSATFEDRFLEGISQAIWTAGDFTLWVVCDPPLAPARAIDEQIFLLPFAKSAVAGLHTPDNTNHAFLLTEDRALVYRGADQPDMSVINPESDVWQSIKLPAVYLADNWPLMQACISSDGRLLAFAGRYGLCHYNSLSGRWKTFTKDAEEQSFVVRGGMHWYGGTLIAAVELTHQRAYKIYCFFRDRPLGLRAIVHEESYDSPIVITSTFDNSLLVYTADNTLYHYLIDKSGTETTLRHCGSIGFEGVVRDPTRVRGMSWMVPHAQQKFGDPADDLNVATLIFLIEGKLVLLRPRRAGQDEVKYDLQVLADKIEFYWTHLSGIGTLENSLWGWDGTTIRVWLNALTIDMPQARNTISQGPARLDNLNSVKESVAIVLDFYPLSVLMDKGIIVGVDHETSLRRSLDFSISRIGTNTHLFLHHILLFHLSHNQIQEAVLFASFYQHLIFFAHALEILLHNVLEEEADALLVSRKSSPNLTASPMFASQNTTMTDEDDTATAPTAVLPRVVEFLDHFDECLQVVVGCARKTEIARWKYLFDIVGNPRELFDKCIQAKQLKVAASYLLVLHTLEPSEQSSRDTVLLIKAGMDAQDWQLCKELLRFLYSLDNSGRLLHSALAEASALPPGFPEPRPPVVQESRSNGHAKHEFEADDDAHPNALTPATGDNPRLSPSTTGSIYSIAQLGLGSFFPRAVSPSS